MNEEFNDRIIGVIFESKLHGKVITVEPQDTNVVNICQFCVFKLRDEDCMINSCDRYDRKDKKDVYFEKIKEKNNK